MQYTRHILLPSGGIEYSDFAEVTPFNVGTILSLSNNFYLASDSEMMLNILSQHVKNLNVLDMYYADCCYVWQFLYNQAMSKASQENVLITNTLCKKCGKEHAIKTPLDKLAIKYLKKSDSNTLTKIFKFSSVGKVHVTRRFRKLKDNINTSYSIMNSEETSAFKQVEDIIGFIKQQIVSVDFENKRFHLDGNDKLFDDFIFSLKIYEILELFEFFRIDDFGILNDMLFECIDCKKENQLIFFDAFSSSHFFTKGMPDDNFQKTIQNIMSIKSSGYMNFKEICEIEYNMFDLYMEAITKAIKAKGGDRKSVV